MKRVYTLLFLIAVAAVPKTILAEATTHVGLGVISTTEYFSSQEDTKAIFNAVQLKLGYADIGAYGVEVDVGYGRYDKNIFSIKDSDYIYFDIALIKAFDVGWSLYPFAKVGFGVGELEVDRAMQNSLSSGSFFGGGGVYVEIADGFDIEAALLYRESSWEEIDLIGKRVESRSRTLQPYVGLNYRF